MKKQSSLQIWHDRNCRGCFQIALQVKRLFAEEDRCHHFVPLRSSLLGILLNLVSSGHISQLTILAHHVFEHRPDQLVESSLLRFA